MNKIYVVGRTTPHEVYVVSNDRKFIMNEYLIIEDETNSNPIGEIIETYSYSKLTNECFEKNLNIYEDIKFLELSTDKEIHIGVLKVIDDLIFPIRTNAKILIPNFSDIENILLTNNAERGLLLGVTRGTNHLVDTLPDIYKDRCYMFDKGEIKGQDGVPFYLNQFLFREYPHIALFGGSGSGKTFALWTICEELMDKRLPGIIADAHFEFDFSTPMEGIAKKIEYDNKYEIFQVGENCGINFTELETSELLKLVSFVGQLSQPMIAAIEELHIRGEIFAKLLGKIAKLKSAFDFYESKFKKNKEDKELTEDEIILFEKYGKKISSKETLQAVLWRLEGLNKMNIFNKDISNIESCLLKRKLAIIRSPSTKLLKIYMSYITDKLYRKRRCYKDGSSEIKFPPFFTIIDEAHRFAPNGGNENPMKLILREMGQESRKYGVFLILATQRPSILDSTLVSQLNTKIIFRTSIQSDMAMIKEETNLSEHDFKLLPSLTAGHAIIASATLKKNFYIKFRCTYTKSQHQQNPIDELEEFNDIGKESESRLITILKRHLPIAIENIPNKHGQIAMEMGINVDVEDILKCLENMAARNEILMESSLFGKRYMNK